MREEVKIWALGDDDRVNEFIQNNFWEIGFDENSNEFKKNIKLLNELCNNDIVVLKSKYLNSITKENYLKVYAIGYVLKKKGNKSISIKWIENFIDSENGFKKVDTIYGKTIQLIKKQSVIKSILGMELEEYLKIKHLNKFRGNKIFSFKIDLNNKGETNMPDNNINQPLNQILYGPPGTGKTYNTINRALEIIENKSLNELEKEDRKELKKRFDEYKEKGQIEFVTFHQSYGYEEFVEGIKADLESDEIKYKLEDGIFKKLCEKAAIKEKLEIALLSIKTQLPLKLKTKTGVEFEVISLNESSLKLNTSQDSEQDIRITELYSLLKNPNTKKIHNWSYAKPFFDYLMEQIKESKEDNKNYILIIDEINRGNISKIFGELITLIEDSKRIGAKEEIKIRLPYSKEEFGVPKNLYIIGTMNTADRSIAPIDTALRRRFVFEEMPPKPELLSSNVDGINLQKLLEAINTRIEYLYDREHCIGHSYLIDVDSLEKLKFAFKNKILPLLAEYFYEDWENINLVLNENGMIIEEKSQDKYLKNIKNSGNKIYKITFENSWNKKTFQKIYETSSNEDNEQSNN